MVARYGDYVLLKPPFKPGTLVLWLGAPLVLLVAGGALLLAARRRRAPEPPAPLTEEERAKVDSLLGARHSDGAIIVEPGEDARSDSRAPSA
jgi:cytochrome c-type biogenesis protein CcmH